MVLVDADADADADDDAYADAYADAPSFVGGDQAGKHIYYRGSQNGKRVQVSL